MLEPGSKLRSTIILEPLFNKHERWDKMKDIISIGVTYPLEDLPEAIYKENVKHTINRGNHKSAFSPENESKFINNFEKEVQHGWLRPVTIECVFKNQMI